MQHLRRYASLTLAALLLTTLAALGGGIARANTITGYLTFEPGRDGASIDLSGVIFTNAGGEPWVYGDVRTRKYNAPYPSSCADRPANIAAPICEYAVGDSLFAWTGVLGGAGRIEFTEGNASFVSFDLSAGSRTNVIAYNADERPIAAVSQLPQGEGRRGTILLQAPTGERIAYVDISGTTNFWLLDNLTTDAPGVPDQRPPERSNPALLTVVQRPSAAGALTPGSTLTLTVVTTNRGKGLAKSALLTMPFDPARVSVSNASFSRSSDWVTRLVTNTLEIQTGPLAAGETMTATLRLQVLPTAPADGAISGRLSFSWSDAAGGGKGRSNALAATVGAPLPAPSLTSEAAGASKRSFTSDVFAPVEPVGVWYNTPAGRAVAVGTLTADREGRLTVSLDTTGLAAGQYTLVALGHWTEFSTVAPFTVAGGAGS